MEIKRYFGPGLWPMICQIKQLKVVETGKKLPDLLAHVMKFSNSLDHEELTPQILSCSVKSIQVNFRNSCLIYNNYNLVFFQSYKFCDMEMHSLNSRILQSISKLWLFFQKEFKMVNTDYEKLKSL